MKQLGKLLDWGRNLTLLAAVVYYFYWASHQPGAKEFDAMKRSQRDLREVGQVFGTNYDFGNERFNRAVAREAAKP